MIMRRIFPAIHAIEPLTADDADAVSDLHHKGFQVSWSADEFTAFLMSEGVFGYAARQQGAPRDRPAGFVLARQAAGEGEVLTVAVDPASRGCGLGRELMDAVIRHLRGDRAEALFLEVDEANRAALALYTRLGFRQVGRRPGYYRQFGGGEACVMRLDL